MSTCVIKHSYLRRKNKAVMPTYAIVTKKTAEYIEMYRLQYIPISEDKGLFKRESCISNTDHYRMFKDKYGCYVIQEYNHETLEWEFFTRYDNLARACVRFYEVSGHNPRLNTVTKTWH